MRSEFRLYSCEIRFCSPLYVATEVSVGRAPSIPIPQTLATSYRTSRRRNPGHMTNNNNNNNNKADHSQSKPPSPKYSGTYRGKTKKGVDRRGSKRSDMVLYVLQTAFYRKLQENM